MKKMRQYVKRRLGEENENILFEQHGSNNDEYIDKFLMSFFKDTNEAGTCKYCKQKTVFVHLKQDRSGDEGMTAHAVCSNVKCNRKWIMY